ncbi:MAG: hypothetical protein H7836_04595 [Magnetococcus sp. YQC-3]
MAKKEEVKKEKPNKSSTTSGNRELRILKNSQREKMEAIKPLRRAEAGTLYWNLIASKNSAKPQGGFYKPKEKKETPLRGMLNLGPDLILEAPQGPTRCHGASVHVARKLLAKGFLSVKNGVFSLTLEGKGELNRLRNS